MDLLVKLYDLPDAAPVLKKLEKRGIMVRRALAPEKTLIVNWVRETFSRAWADECDVTFGRSPISTLVAVDGGTLVGFACHDATCKNFFGPTGVDPDFRKGGVGKGLLLATLSSMAADGYAYAIIGGVGPIDYYKKAVHALEIPKSTPGIYRGMLA
jgi:GNAT superfamily N-acetyltransferase